MASLCPDDEALPPAPDSVRAPDPGNPPELRLGGRIRPAVVDVELAAAQRFDGVRHEAENQSIEVGGMRSPVAGIPLRE